MRHIGNSWDKVLSDEFSSTYFSSLLSNIEHEYQKYKVFPRKEDVFSAMKTVDYSNVKVVILGQDPYHGDGQANGMAFAVNEGVALPPSLVNIFKEIQSEFGECPKGGTLRGWASQGVLLLNTVLTVREGCPQSHSAYGWQQFTDGVINACNKRDKGMVFMLWGANAQSKKRLISKSHLVLESVHPSPLSAYRGFFGCNHFRLANEFLINNGFEPVDWLKTDLTDNQPYYGEGKILRA